MFNMVKRRGLYTFLEAELAVEKIPRSPVMSAAVVSRKAVRCMDAPLAITMANRS
jgi:hypothetical protein